MVAEGWELVIVKTRATVVPGLVELGVKTAEIDGGVLPGLAGLTARAEAGRAAPAIPTASDRAAMTRRQRFKAVLPALNIYGGRIVSPPKDFGFTVAVRPGSVYT
jgi:hypothetical protein